MTATTSRRKIKVDIELAVMPVLLGAGISLFRGSFPQGDFTLVSHQAHPSGVIRMSYARVSAMPPRQMHEGRSSHDHAKHVPIP